MPQTEIHFYSSPDGRIPVREWLQSLRWRDRAAWQKCAARIRTLGAQGHEARRPVGDFLRDGIYELRVRRGRVQIRILYFSHGRQAIVLAHALFKEGRVPDTDIERALARKRAHETKPEAQTWKGNWEDV